MKLIKTVLKNKDKILVGLFMFFVCTNNLFSQEADAKKTKPKKNEADTRKLKQLPSATLGVGVLTFNGDVGGGFQLSSLGRIKTGYNLAIEQRIGHYVGVSLGGLYGKLSNDENVTVDNLNFQSKFYQGELLLIGHTDNDLMFKHDMIFAPYLYVGIGYMHFDPYSDTKDKNDKTYHYWQDGTIRDIDEDAPNYFMAQPIHRDYTYETKLDTTSAYSHSALVFPLGVGFKFKINYNFDFNLNATYYLTNTDWIDNLKGGKNDKYLYLSVALQYNFGSEKDNTAPIYKGVDFSSLDKLDSDEDGVKDKNDKCPGTPKTVKVDDSGCPLDEDKDGVPNYKDKELNTIAGSIVDADGVTMSEETIKRNQMMYDSLATERGKLLFENPNLAYLADVETNIKKAHAENKIGAKAIPEKLKIADKNGDGFIDTSEITKSIDEFFDGETGWTVEKLNDLIDFFFEQ